jgi:NADH-quinone oxidoreductase subunit J
MNHLFHNSLNLIDFFTYLFGGVCIFAAIIVIRARNPIHSVIFLILVFCNAAGILLMLGVEFLAMIFLVVYVGAIAVLFLFVVMMLQIKLADLEDELFQYLPIGALVGVLFLIETYFVLSKDFTPLIQSNQTRLLYLD